LTCEVGDAIVVCVKVFYNFVILHLKHLAAVLLDYMFSVMMAARVKTSLRYYKQIIIMICKAACEGFHRLGWKAEHFAYCLLHVGFFLGLGLKP
jgi:hypothetical protein